jgi:hypothetical protein
MSADKSEHYEESAVKSIGWKLLPWVADALCAMLCYYAFQFNVELKEIRKDVVELREWRAETAGNRWTAGDQTLYSQKQAEELSKVWNKISEIQQTWLRDVSDIRIQLGQLPKRDELPPQWFRDYVKGVENKIDKHIDSTPRQP